MSLGSQKDYWNSRASKWESYDAPLVPSKQDLQFLRKHLVPDGDALILGATPEICRVALEICQSVTAVDFAAEVIRLLQTKNVEYVCSEWNEYLSRTNKQFDNIITDGGLACLEYPGAWQQIAKNITSALLPKGVFIARTYISTPEPPQKKYDNPNMQRFIAGLAKVDYNWMLELKKHDDYANYDVRYAFPPDEQVIQTFSNLKLLDRLVPDYEEGRHFVSFAWQKA